MVIKERNGRGNRGKKIGEVMNMSSLTYLSILIPVKNYPWQTLGEGSSPPPLKKNGTTYPLVTSLLFSLVEWPVNQAYMIGLFCKNCSGQYSKVILWFGFLCCVYPCCSWLISNIRGDNGVSFKLSNLKLYLCLQNFLAPRCRREGEKIVSLAVFMMAGEK